MSPACNPLMSSQHRIKYKLLTMAYKTPFISNYISYHFPTDSL